MYVVVSGSYHYRNINLACMVDNNYVFDITVIILLYVDEVVWIIQTTIMFSTKLTR